MDFTWEELQSLRLIQERPYRDQQYNDQFQIASFDAYLTVAVDKNVGIYPETKTPKFFAEHLPDFKMEDLMISQIEASGLEADQVILQSFDPESLRKFYTQNLCNPLKHPLKNNLMWIKWRVVDRQV